MIRKKLQIAKDSPDFWCWKAHTQDSRVWKVEQVRSRSLIHPTSDARRRSNAKPARWSNLVAVACAAHCQRSMVYVQPCLFVLSPIWRPSAEIIFSSWLEAANKLASCCKHCAVVRGCRPAKSQLRRLDYWIRPRPSPACFCNDVHLSLLFQCRCVFVASGTSVIGQSIPIEFH